MNKNKMKAYIWIGIVSVILGIIISFQIKVIKNKLLEGYAPNAISSQLSLELENVRNEKELLISENELIKMELEVLHAEYSKENILAQALTNEVEKIKKFAGLIDVVGQGVEVIISDNKAEYSTGTSSIIYEYNLILSFVNELNAAGAEAISINGQRFVNTTEIRTAGNNLLVNGVPVTQPIRIKTIGNSRTLSASLNQRYGIVAIMRDKGYFVETAQVNEIEIKKFDGKIEFMYLENANE